MFMYNQYTQMIRLDFPKSHTIKHSTLNVIGYDNMRVTSSVNKLPPHVNTSINI